MNLDFDALKTEKQEITDFLSQPNAYADPNFAPISHDSKVTSIVQFTKNPGRYSSRNSAGAYFFYAIIWNPTPSGIILQF